MLEPSVGDVILGAAGADVSTVTTTGVLAGLVLPPASVCVTVRLLSPSGSAVAGVMVNVPPAVQVAVGATAVPFTSSVTVLPASQVPFISGVVSLVLEPSVGDVILGAAGADVSTVTTTGVLAGLVLPPASVCVTVRLLSPSGSGVAGVMVNVPPAVQVAVGATAVPFTSSVTVLPASQVPFISGVVSLVLEPSVGDVILGAAGGIVSITYPVSCAFALVPAPSVAVTLISPLLVILIVQSTCVAVVCVQTRLLYVALVSTADILTFAADIF